MGQLIVCFGDFKDPVPTKYLGTYLVVVFCFSATFFSHVLPYCIERESVEFIPKS